MDAIILDNPPTGSSASNLKYTISMTDMDIFNDIIELIRDMLQDENIDKGIRDMYFDKLGSIINLDDDYTEL